MEADTSEVRALENIYPSHLIAELTSWETAQVETRSSKSTPALSDLRSREIWKSPSFKSKGIVGNASNPEASHQIQFQNAINDGFLLATNTCARG